MLNKNIVKSSFVLILTTAGGWSILRYGLRGQMFSLLFLTTNIYILTKIKKWKTKTVLLGLLFLLWANFHGSYLLGVILSLTWLFIQIFASPKTNRNLCQILATGAIIMIAPLINPYGINNYLYVLQTMTTPLNTMIAEWVPPNKIDKIIITSVFSLYIYLAYKERTLKEIKTKLFWFLVVLGNGYLVFKARSYLPQYFLVQALALSQLNTANKILEKTSKQLQEFTVLVLLGTTLVLILLIITPKTIAINSNWENYCRMGMTTYPCQAVDYIQDNKLSGNIFNYYRWGGFLTWQLPGSKIFVDGHIPGRKLDSNQYPYNLHLQILQAKNNYQQKLDHYQTDYILIPPNTFLDIELKKKDGSPWEIIYEDNVSALYKRVD